MADHFTETSTRGFGSRLGNSFAGFIIGPLLVIGAVVLLWWNEGRAVQAIVGLRDAASQVIEADVSGPSPANANKLIHLVGPATAQAPIQDSDVGITFADQVAIVRSVEMYQWKETKKEDTQENMGGSTTTTTTYDYSKEWSDDPINSSDFKHPDGHQNPQMPFSNKRFAASNAKLGGWRLDPGTLDRISLSQALAPTAPSGWTPSGDNYYRGDPASPKVGDMRVHYVGLPSGTTISVMAMQSGDGFAVFTTKNGYQLELAEIGDHPSTEMIEAKRKSEAVLTWILRGVGMLVMYVGFAAFLAPLSTFAAVIPLLGGVVRGAVGLVALVLAVPLSILVMAFAWLAYRPLIGGALIVLGRGGRLRLVALAQVPRPCSFACRSRPSRVNVLT
jgi:Transmembrane protein 43